MTCSGHLLFCSSQHTLLPCFQGSGGGGASSTHWVEPANPPSSVHRPAPSLASCSATGLLVTPELAAPVTFLFTGIKYPTPETRRRRAFLGSQFGRSSPHSAGFNTYTTQQKPWQKNTPLVMAHRKQRGKGRRREMPLPGHTPVTALPTRPTSCQQVSGSP